MEKYEGIKFKTSMVASDFPADNRLLQLNHWVYIFAELGLAPVHPEGAFGNHSYRHENDTFVITRTGMIPQIKLHNEDYCAVTYDTDKETFQVKGRFNPSSECFLHALIYRSFPQVQTIMHGHSSLLNSHAAELNIPVTAREFPYGTKELALSAVEYCTPDHAFFIMRNHGFVAAGLSINSTAKSVLLHYEKLLHHLKKNLE